MYTNIPYIDLMGRCVAWKYDMPLFLVVGLFKRPSCVRPYASRFYMFWFSEVHQC